jgi:hypothetical protein
MNYKAISELVAEYIEGSLVSAAFFSTYSFESDFFELEIMPLLMSQQVGQTGDTYQPALSTNDAIRWQQLERLMAQKQIHTSVIYDPSVYRCERAPRLEVAYHGYSPGNGCQHAKLIAILLESPEIVESETDTGYEVLFGAGSFNLTRAGWWDNIECGHFIKLSTLWAPENLCSEVISALKFYLNQTSGNDLSLQKIIDTINSFPKTANEEQLSFYFSNDDRKQKSFVEFVAPEIKYKTLEVISPYFAESGDNSTISRFLAKFDKCKVLLPRDPRDISKVKLDKSVYDKLTAQEVKWCYWQNEVLKSVEEKEVTRELHAKIYRMEHEHGSDLFIGSVNFSYKAFQDNIEAGFLIKNADEVGLLAELPSGEYLFEEQKGELHGDNLNEGPILPNINLSYCWKNKLLTLIDQDVVWLQPVSLHDASQNNIALIESKGGKLGSVIITNIEAFEQYLKNSSLVSARSINDENLCVNREVVISQVSTFARPSFMPPLSLTDLLSIFRGMEVSKLVQLTEQYAAIELASTYASNEGFTEELKPSTHNFFSEFSEINSAFFHLNRSLLKAQLDGDQRTLDYYFIGKQPDSLYGAFQLLTNEKSAELTPVLRYLSLLSIQDTLQRIGNDNSELIIKVERSISAIEAGNQLQLTENNDPDFNQRFLVWFKQEFLYQSTISTVGDSQ